MLLVLYFLPPGSAPPPQYLLSPLLAVSISDRLLPPVLSYLRFSTQNNILSGVTLLSWLQIVWRYRRGIEWRTYWFRILFLTCLACLNSFLAIIEEVRSAVAVGDLRTARR